MKNDGCELFLYTKEGCSACNSFRSQLDELRIPYSLIDISTDPDLQHRYGARIPVLEAGSHEICQGIFDRERVLACCRSATGY